MTSVSELIKYEDVYQVIQYNPFTNHTVAAMEKNDKHILLKHLQLFGIEQFVVSRMFLFKSS
jgi:hypothetical protein